MKTRIMSHRKKIMFAGAAATGGAVYAYESHVQECPITGRSRFVALYPEQMKKISREEFEGLLEEYKSDIVTSDSEVYDRVVRVANRLLSGNKDIRQIYDKTWTVTLVDQPVQNAFVLPHGNIFVFRGMMELCDNDDQLAVILGHEMAHAILGHVAEKLTMANFIQLIILVPMAVLWAVIPSDGIALVTDWFFDKVIEICFNLPFSRELELEADVVGLTLAAKACFDVREAPAFWKRMEFYEEIEAPGSNDKDLEFLFTHPVHSTRYETLSTQMSQALQLRLDCGCSNLDPRCDPQIRIREMEKVREEILREKSEHNDRVVNGEGYVNIVKNPMEDKQQIYSQNPVTSQSTITKS